MINIFLTSKKMCIHLHPNNMKIKLSSWNLLIMIIQTHRWQIENLLWANSIVKSENIPKSKIKKARNVKHWKMMKKLREPKRWLKKKIMIQKYTIKTKINKKCLSNLTLKIQLHLISKDFKQVLIWFNKKHKKYRTKTKKKHQLKI